ncbi:hypothetical protein WJX73_008528 [Symbiochloris irregularis]|uniref:[Phosphatase 2A protein]-leucine-carboxy methyltransferase 1 n=1 Tax=Symbiochloris irregularis TaxID=706552 RepID=A0AAW1P4E0_9CHLO
MANAATLNTEQGSIVDEELSKFVSWTARLVAAHRALETEEPDALLTDPLAKAFAGQKALDFVLGMQRDKPDQCSEIFVVLLGAGLDARPWRLPLPFGLKWYEIDLSEVLRVKEKALQANGAPMNAEDNAGARVPVRASQFEQFLGECGWKIVKLVEMDDVAHDVIPGFEYNGPKRPEGRVWYYSFGVFSSIPAMAKD